MTTVDTVPPTNCNDAFLLKPFNPTFFPETELNTLNLNHLGSIVNYSSTYADEASLHFRNIGTQLLARSVKSQTLVPRNYDGTHSEREKLFICDKCGKIFTYERQLLLHSAVHSESDPHQFVTCNATVYHRDDLCKRTLADTPLEECGLTFSRTAAGLKREHFIHIGIKLFECTICRMSFSDKASLNVHERIHSEEKPFRCEVCNNSFALKNDLYVHLRSHTEVKPYPCLECPRVFRHRSHLKSHMNTHKGRPLHKCAECSRTYTHGRSFRRHMLTHSGGESHKCTYCGKVFGNQVSLITHIKVHAEVSVASGGNGETYVCKHCSMAFATPLSLDTHLKHHNRSRRASYAKSYFFSLEKSFQCQQCGTAFRKKSHLRSHMDKHTDRNNYKCPICDVTYKHFRSLHRHMLSHKDIEVHKCDTCCNFFKTAGDLSNHACTPNKGSFTCKTCGEFFTEHKLLVDHFQELHTDQVPNFEDSNSADSILLPSSELPVVSSDNRDKPFVCEECGTAFRKKGHLRSHADKHTQGKPYTCPVCSVAYKHERSLARHMSDHGTETSFKCEMCRAFFKTRENLSSHVCSAANEKPFNCKMCGATFGDRSSLENHSQLHVGEILVFQNL